jgi:protein SCO1/2
MTRNGQVVKLREFFNKGRPVLLDLVYYNCPQLCTLILNGKSRSCARCPGRLAEHTKSSASASIRGRLLKSPGQESHLSGELRKAAPGWHFLTDREDNAKRLAELIGYHYRWDPRIQQYAHLAGSCILTPEGKVARYLYGINYRALTFVSDWPRRQKIAAPDHRKVLLFCYHYDPVENKYVLFATNFMKAGGVLPSDSGWFLFRMIRSSAARSVRMRRCLANRQEGRK